MKKIAVLLFVLGLSVPAISQTVDYSVVSVPEESGIDFTRVTTENDYVCMPIVTRSRTGINWLTNKIIDVSSDGSRLAFLSMRNNATNIFVKDITRQGPAVQRTNRKAVLDFSYSPNGRYIAFSEAVAKNNVIFQTDASSGFVCRQITSGNNDYSPVYSNDGSRIFFARQESKSASIWSYDISDNFLSSYSTGMNPCTIDDPNAVLCVRVNGYGKGEIWKINFMTGVEECIISDTEKSFTTPSLSPDGNWIVFIGSTPIYTGSSTYWNTDIYACRTDGTHFMQLTYHAADDLSPEWSKDGKYIYFISQRGSGEGSANVWRMSFVYL
ncbi:MAG: PD40 domain-containing protein [Bacteroidales bacterium]|nr:PD40 domain-containing protein [Bacteroidales bacterium]